MQDQLLRVLAKEEGVLLQLCATTAIANDAARRHATAPLATAALGYALTGITLLGGLLKVKQRVSLKIAGNGALRKIVVESDSYGRVRGYVANPDLVGELPITDAAVAHAIGDEGVLTVVKDLRVRGLYQGVVPLESGELDRELAAYLKRSEQVASLVEMGVRTDNLGQVSAAGGLLAQMLPGHDAKRLTLLAERLDDLPGLDQLLLDGETLIATAAVLLRGLNYMVLEERPVRFQCSCNWERSRQALLSLGEDGIQSLIAEGEAVVDCHFCHERYVFGTEVLETLLTELA